MICVQPVTDARVPSVSSHSFQRVVDDPIIIETQDGIVTVEMPHKAFVMFALWGSGNRFIQQRGERLQQAISHGIVRIVCRPALETVIVERVA